MSDTSPPHREIRLAAATLCVTEIVSWGVLCSIGYEGRDLGAFIETLRELDTDAVADVRLNALSRKKGFSKNQLRIALADAGIDYAHLRSLGNPKDNREPVLVRPPRRGVRRIPRAALRGRARRCSRTASRMASTQVVAVLCFEHATVGAIGRS